MGILTRLAGLKREAEVAGVALAVGAALGAFVTLRWFKRQERAIQAVQEAPRPQEAAKDGGTVLERKPGPVPAGASRVVKLDFQATRPIAVGQHVQVEVRQLDTQAGTREEVKTPEASPVKLAEGLDTVGPMPVGAGRIRVNAWTALATWSPQEGAGVAVQRSWGPWVFGAEATRREVRVMAGITW